MSYKSVHTLQQKRWNLAQFFEERWWKNYLRKQPKKDYLDWKHSYWQDFLLKTRIQLKNGERILDAGTGPAGIQMILSKQSVVAIDPLLDMYEKLDHFDPSFYPWTSFRRSAIESMQEEASFDHVFCLNVINHVVDIEQACDRLCAALRPGGTLVMSIDCHKYSWAKRVLKSIPLDILHPHQYNLEEYIALLSKRGIRIKHQACMKKGGLFDYWVISGEKA